MQRGEGWDPPWVLLVHPERRVGCSAGPACSVGLVMAPLVHGTAVCKEYSLSVITLSAVAVTQYVNGCGHYHCVQMSLGIFSVKMHPWRDAPFYFTDSAKPCCFPTPFLSSLPLLRLRVRH